MYCHKTCIFSVSVCYLVRIIIVQGGLELLSLFESSLLYSCSVQTAVSLLLGLLLAMVVERPRSLTMVVSQLLKEFFEDVSTLQ